MLDWTEVFGRDGDVVLDVGFGHGESTIEMAAAQPDLDVIGVEVHTPGVVTVLDAIEHRASTTFEWSTVTCCRSSTASRPSRSPSSGSTSPTRGRSAAISIAAWSAATWWPRCATASALAANCTSPPTSPTTPKR